MAHRTEKPVLCFVLLTFIVMSMILLTALIAAQQATRPADRFVVSCPSWAVAKQLLARPIG